MPFVEKGEVRVICATWHGVSRAIEDDLENTHNRERNEKMKTDNEKRGTKRRKAQQTVAVSSSSEDSEMSFHDTSDYERCRSDIQDDDEDDGDFVVGKTKTYNYIGRVENIEGQDVTAKFLMQTKQSVEGKPAFMFKEKDEGIIPREDVLQKLPTPQKLGGTARREGKYLFPCFPFFFNFFFQVHSKKMFCFLFCFVVVLLLNLNLFQRVHE